MDELKEFSGSVFLKLRNEFSTYGIDISVITSRMSHRRHCTFVMSNDASEIAYVQ